MIESMVADVSVNFDVPEVDATTAKSLHSDKRFLFLDVRTPTETQVSMIANAITQQQFEKNPDVYKDKNIIVYCTIGYRSSKFVEQWNKRGFQMKNLRGSLLLWSYAEGALVDHEGKLTRRVHVYGKKWDLMADSYQAVY